MADGALISGQLVTQVTVDGINAVRPVVAVEHQIDGVWRVAGSGFSGSGGQVLIDIQALPESLIYALAVDDWGTAWSASKVVAVGDVIRPTSFVGLVYRVTQAGTLPAGEPTWWDESVPDPRQVGTAMLKVARYYRPLAHGPVPVSFVTLVGDLPAFQFGQPYSAGLSAVGLTAPLTWSITAGSLPVGLSMNSSTGLITGTFNTTPKGYTFTITAQDSQGLTASRSYTVGTRAVYTFDTDPAGKYSIRSGSPSVSWNSVSQSLVIVGTQDQPIVAWDATGNWTGAWAFEMDLTLSDDWFGRRHFGFFIDSGTSGLNGYRVAQLDTERRMTRFTGPTSFDGDAPLNDMVAGVVSPDVPFTMKLTRSVDGLFTLYFDGMPVGTSRRLDYSQFRPGFFAYGCTLRIAELRCWSL